MAANGRSLAWASLLAALVGIAAFLYTGRFGDTLLGVALVYACGPLAIVLAIVAWWRTRASRTIAVAGIVLAIALMGMLGYALWWVTTQSR